MIKIFDLDNPPDLGPDLQNNLSKIYDLFGSQFTTKSGNIEFPTILEKRMLPNDVWYYSFMYDEPNRTNELRFIKIDFYNRVTAQTDNQAFINNIRKTDKISGTEMVKLVLQICRILGVKKVLLGDGASIPCGNVDVDLSFIKLLEYDMTFYMKLGFDFEITNDQYPPIRFTDKTKLKKEVSNLISQIRQIRTKDILDECRKIINLVSDVAKTQDFAKFKVLLRDRDDYIKIDTFYRDKLPEFVGKIFQDCYDIITILLTSQEEYLYKLMICLFNKECKKYITLKSYMTSPIYKIIYDSDSIDKTYNILFNKLALLRGVYRYSYTF